MEVIFMLKAEELKLVSEWDKTFPKSEKVDHEKVTFVYSGSVVKTKI